MQGFTAACTYNLHLLNCRLADQVRERGATWQWLELWVERYIQEMKSRTKYRTHGAPEKVILGDYLVGAAMRRAAVQLAGGNQQLFTYDEWRRGPGAAGGGGATSGNAGAGVGGGGSREGGVWGEDSAAAAADAGGMSSAVDSAVDATTGQLLDAGQQVDLGGAMWQLVRGRLVACINNNAAVTGVDAAGWQAAIEADEVEVRQHARAQLPESAMAHRGPAGVQVTSSSYTRSRTRDGSHVMVMYAKRGGDWEEWAARVQCYVRIMSLAPAGPAGVLRFALVEHYKRLTPLKDRDVANVVLRAKEGAMHDSNYPVLLSMVAAPLAVARRRTAAGTFLYMVPFKFKSGACKPLG